MPSIRLSLSFDELLFGISPKAKKKPSPINDNPDCYEIYELVAPICEPECDISELTATLKCDGDHLFAVIDFEYSGTVDSFILSGNGVTYGTYAYSNLPVFVSPEAGLDGYEFIVRDKAHDSCKEVIELAPFDCSHVWPGDVNRDGIVNNQDLIYIGIAFEKNSPKRLE